MSGIYIFSYATRLAYDLKLDAEGAFLNQASTKESVEGEETESVLLALGLLQTGTARFSYGSSTLPDVRMEVRTPTPYKHLTYTHFSACPRTPLFYYIYYSRG